MSLRSSVSPCIPALRLIQPGEYVQQAVVLAEWTTNSTRLESACGLQTDSSGRGNGRSLVRTGIRSPDSLGWDTGTLGTFGCGRLGSHCLSTGFYSRRGRRSHAIGASRLLRTALRLSCSQPLLVLLVRSIAFGLALSKLTPGPASKAWGLPACLSGHQPCSAAERAWIV